MNSLVEKKIYVAGHQGMVGSAVTRKLRALGARNLVLRTSRELDLRCQAATRDLFSQHQPQIVVFCASRVGGIQANHTFPAEFIYDNLAMEIHAIHSAYEFGCERFLFLGSTCIYPCQAPQPLKESYLLTGPLEKTNEAYAVAKIAGVKLCEYYRRQYGVLCHSAMPTNLYGPGDNYHPENSHVLPGLIRRFHEAKLENRAEVCIWGTGRPRREFLHVDDLADALIHLLGLDCPPNMVNVGTGQDISIQELAELIADIVGYQGQIMNDPTKPDGTMLKRTDTSLINQTGWRPKISLRHGIAQTYQCFLQELQEDRIRER